MKTDLNILRKRRAHFLGVWAEWLCALLLICKGYRILAVRCRTPVGEIDIVAKRGNMLVIVEVKARRRAEDALASVDQSKRRRLGKAAEALMVQRKFAGLARAGDRTMRFDVMAVLPWRLPVHVVDAWRPEF